MIYSSPSKPIQQLLLVGLSVLAALKLTDVLLLISDPGIDFGAFYKSTLEWRYGREPYPQFGIDPPNLTPPVMLLAFAPLTYLPLGIARVIWSIVSLVCLGLSVILASRHIELARHNIFIILLAASPTALALGLGQLSFVLMLAMTLAWIETRRNRLGRAGVLLGIVCFVKPFYGFFFLWQLWRRDWHGAIAFSGAFIFCLLLSIFLVGIDQFTMWLDLLQNISWGAHIYNASILGLGERFFGPAKVLPAAMWTPLFESKVMFMSMVSLLIALVISVTAWRLSKFRSVSEVLADSCGERSSATDIDEAFAVISAAGILLSPLAWLHYLTVSAAPMLAVLTHRHIRWGASMLVLSILPYQPFINIHHGLLGTMTIGLWAPGQVMLILVATVFGKNQKK